jgi:hypothetical protein
LTHIDRYDHRFYHIVDELEADEAQGSRLALAHLANDRCAWIGAA